MGRVVFQERTDSVERDGTDAADVQDVIVRSLIAHSESAVDRVQFLFRLLRDLG